MRPGMKKFWAVLSAATISCVTMAGCSGGITTTTEQTASPETEAETEAEVETEPEAETEAETAEEETEAEAPQLTLDDIKQMNGGDIRYNVNSEGNITFLAGKFYDGKIEDGDDVLRALEGMSTLIGADENTAYEKGDAVQDDNGYTYYTLWQWHGDSEVAGSIVKIIVSPDKEAAAISSSVQPGINAGTDMVISQEDAVEAVRTYLVQTSPEVSYTFYTEQVDKATVPDGESVEDDHIFRNAYVVYTDNPDNTAEQTDFPYLAHYVSSEGEYLYEMPVFNIGSEAVEVGGNSQSIFEGKTVETYTGNVTLHDGSTQEISVPVLYDETEGVYYLADAERKIAVADYSEFVYNGSNLKFSTSMDNEDWDDKELLTYSKYMKVYDFYHEVGWNSPDGRGTPILLLSGMCDEDQNPVDGACYFGKYKGWCCFAFSAVNDYGECLDVLAHEYTHGVTYTMMTSILYQGETGAINEAMSDIMGNIAEMLLGATDDTTWLMAENCGVPIRSMTDPHSYAQPAYIGDVYYGPEPIEPNTGNDQGGVHKNNSIISSIAPVFHEAGMTLEEQQRLWITAICALTPKSGFKDFYEILSNAAKITGLGEYQELIDETFTDLCIIGENTENQGKLTDGCGRFSFLADPSVSQYQADQTIIFVGEGEDQYAMSTTWADKNNMISSQLFEGDYYIREVAFDSETGEKGRFYYSADGWTQDPEAEIPITITAGEEIELMDFVIENE